MLLWTLVGVLALVAALITWQHATRTRDNTFGVEDAVAFIAQHLDGDVRRRVGTDGIRRIVEWEVYYLQGLAQKDRRNPVETVAGPYGPAIDYITSQIDHRHGHAYSEDDVRAVLEQEVAYLFSIGAVGDPVGDDGP
jgi:hypothetical protein